MFIRQRYFFISNALKRELSVLNCDLLSIALFLNLATISLPALFLCIFIIWKPA